jgi:23S rRNA (pseudouridine1915-N3)-methyltransferase
LVLAVGRIKERGIREAIDDYMSRVDHHLPIEELEVRDAPEAELARALEMRLPSTAHVVALDVTGKAMTSEAFARWLAARTAEGKGKVVFIIGGPDGIPARIRERAQEKLSLSSMTLPHRLARLILVEQLYRAGTILRGEPYARL